MLSITKQQIRRRKVRRWIKEELPVLIFGTLLVASFAYSMITAFEKQLAQREARYQIK